MPALVYLFRQMWHDKRASAEHKRAAKEPSESRWPSIFISICSLSQLQVFLLRRLEQQHQWAKLLRFDEDKVKPI